MRQSCRTWGEYKIESLQERSISCRN